MTTIEYKVEHIHEFGSHDKALMARLNEWAREGWRVANVDLTPPPIFGPKDRQVLLEREVQTH